MNETNVVVYSGFTSWSGDDTYADGYAASLLGVPGTVLVLLVQCSPDTPLESVSYGGQSFTYGGTDTNSQLSLLWMDLIANPPSDDTLSVTVSDSGPFSWTAMTVTGVDATQTSICAATNASLPPPVIQGPPWFPVSAFTGQIFVWAIQSLGSGSACEFLSTDPAPFSTPVVNASPPALTGAMSALYQQPAQLAPTFTFSSSDGSDINVDGLLLYPLIALLTQYAGARLQQVYPPVMLAKTATINPKIYMPVQNMTVKTKP